MLALKFPPFEADKPYGMCDITVEAVGFLDFPCFFFFAPLQQEE